MIFRAAMAIAMVWLMMPHHPDLRWDAPAAEPGESMRTAILTRLHRVGLEIAEQRIDHAFLVWDGRGAALQNAGHPPDTAIPRTFNRALLHSYREQIR